MTQLTHRGAVAYQAGLAAEACIADDYERRGYPIAARRWRGQGGEIDLVARDGDGLVFIEVKKSRSFDRAVASARLPGFMSLPRNILGVSRGVV